MRIITLLLIMVLSATAIIAAPGEKYTYHTVEKGQTLYSISKMYGMKPADLAQFNGVSPEKMVIRIGQKLKVPSSSAAEEESTPSAPAPVLAKAASESSDNYHVVKKGETFFSISRTYNVSRADLQAWNNLQDLNLKVGQKLIVSGATGDVKPVEKAPAATTHTVSAPAKKEKHTNVVPVVHEPNEPAAKREDVNGSPALTALADSKEFKSWKTENTSDRIESNKAAAVYDPASEYESLYYQNVYSGMAKKTEKGVVKVQKDNNPACTAYYSNATVGTILKLTNPANGKTTYALVVGKIPPGENNSYLLKISDRVSRNLLIKDYASVEVVCYTAN